MKNLKSGLMASAVAFAFAGTAYAEGCDKVIFSDVGWTDITATTATASVLLKALGYESAECVVVSLDATRERALNIAMNKISGEWDTKKLENLLSDLKAEDFDVTLTGFDTSEIGLMLGVDDEIVQDIVPEVNADEPTVCQPGDIWQLGRHRRRRAAHPGQGQAAVRLHLPAQLLRRSGPGPAHRPPGAAAGADPKPTQAGAWGPSILR